ncbi:unnamed protein product [Cuscuta campestris]|uniref:Tf2-1-like SH3-like domain-containing protein n=1 Tax=Cuscuta campestris TaxID=132261 RepID=A0A484KW69_9ASTE|nr:unnamed protein product [Cuscuta campestris]
MELILEITEMEEFELKHQAWTATLSHRPTPLRDSGGAKPYGAPSQAPLLPTPGSKPLPGAQVAANPPIRRLSFAEKRNVMLKGSVTIVMKNGLKAIIGFQFTVDVFVLPIHGPNMVLGVQWLRLLGKALYGRPPPDLVPYNRGESKVQAVDDLLAERDALLRRLRANLQAAQVRMKLQANRQRREVEFQVGDWVLLWLQPYRQHFVARRSSQKLALHYYGPFEVLQRVGPVAYRLKLPDSARIHLVFHVSVLRPFLGQDTNSGVLPLPDDLVDGRPPSHPVQLHATHWVLRHGVREEQFLVSWSDGSLDDATWEPAALICEHYPHLHIEDNVVSDGRESDTVGPTSESLPSHTERRTGTRHRRAPAWQKDFEMH